MYRNHPKRFPSPSVPCLECCSLLQLSFPQPAVDNLYELNKFHTRCLAAGCLHQSGSRLPQSKMGLFYSLATRQNFCNLMGHSFRHFGNNGVAELTVGLSV